MMTLVWQVTKPLDHIIEFNFLSNAMGWMVTQLTDGEHQTGEAVPVGTHSHHRKYQCQPLTLTPDLHPHPPPSIPPNIHVQQIPMKINGSEG